MKYYPIWSIEGLTSNCPTSMYGAYPSHISNVYGILPCIDDVIHRVVNTYVKQHGWVMLHGVDKTTSSGGETY